MFTSITYEWLCASPSELQRGRSKRHWRKTQTAPLRASAQRAEPQRVSSGRRAYIGSAQCSTCLTKCHSAAGASTIRWRPDPDAIGVGRLETQSESPPPHAPPPTLQPVSTDRGRQERGSVLTTEECRGSAGGGTLGSYLGESTQWSEMSWWRRLLLLCGSCCFVCWCQLHTLMQLQAPFKKNNKKTFKILLFYLFLRTEPEAWMMNLSLIFWDF